MFCANLAVSWLIGAGTLFTGSVIVQRDYCQKERKEGGKVLGPKEEMICHKNSAHWFSANLATSLLISFYKLRRLFTCV